MSIAVYEKFRMCVKISLMSVYIMNDKGGRSIEQNGKKEAEYTQITP